MTATRPSREELLDHLRHTAFRPRSDVTSVGAEIELIPLSLSDRSRVPVEGDAGSLAMVRSAGESRGWDERRSAKGTPVFDITGGGSITWEPGGQLELSSAPAPTAGALLDRMAEVLEVLESAAEERGILLIGSGIDPYNGVDQVPLQFDCQRYLSMACYFDSLGPAGVRMMRQTATVHVNLDLGDEPEARWRLLNGLAPYLVALFASSAIAGGKPSGYRSYRAQTWRETDPARTGLALSPGVGMVEGYFDFAMRAPYILGPAGSQCPPFEELWRDGGGRGSVERWDEHLTTLFPEVRPRGYFEVRSIDALPARWLPAPVVLLLGLTYDKQAALAAADLVTPADPGLLTLAGQAGLRDPRIRATGRELFRLGLGGARRLESLVPERYLAVAERFYENYTSRGRSPADGFSGWGRDLAAFQLAGSGAG